MTEYQIKTNNKINTIHKAISEKCLKVTEWEKGYIKTMQARNKKRILTWKEMKIINEIYTKIE